MSHPFLQALRIFLIASISLSIVGCATRPVSNADAKNVPIDRVIDQQYSAPRAAVDGGLVTIKRDKGFGGSACSSRIFVNAKPVADLQSSEKIMLHVPAGDYVFSAWPNGICGGGMSEVRSTIRPKEELNFRVGYGSNGDFTINATAF